MKDNIQQHPFVNQKNTLDTKQESEHIRKSRNIFEVIKLRNVNHAPNNKRTSVGGGSVFCTTKTLIKNQDSHHDLSNTDMNIWLACSIGDMSFVQNTMKRNPHLLYSRDAVFNHTPLYYACSSGQSKIVHLLLKGGINETNGEARSLHNLNEDCCKLLDQYYYDNKTQTVNGTNQDIGWKSCNKDNIICVPDENIDSTPTNFLDGLIWPFNDVTDSRTQENSSTEVSKDVKKSQEHGFNTFQSRIRRRSIDRIQNIKKAISTRRRKQFIEGNNQDTSNVNIVLPECQHNMTASDIVAPEEEIVAFEIPLDCSNGKSSEKKPPLQRTPSFADLFVHKYRKTKENIPITFETPLDCPNEKSSEERPRLQRTPSFAELFVTKYRKTKENISNINDNRLKKKKKRRKKKINHESSAKNDSTKTCSPSKSKDQPGKKNNTKEETSRIQDSSRKKSGIKFNKERLNTDYLKNDDIAKSSCSIFPIWFENSSTNPSIHQQQQLADQAQNKFSINNRSRTNDSSRVALAKYFKGSLIDKNNEKVDVKPGTKTNNTVTDPSKKLVEANSSFLPPQFKWTSEKCNNEVELTINGKSIHAMPVEITIIDKKTTLLPSCCKKRVTYQIRDSTKNNRRSSCTVATAYSSYSDSDEDSRSDDGSYYSDGDDDDTDSYYSDEDDEALPYYFSEDTYDEDISDPSKDFCCFSHNYFPN